MTRVRIAAILTICLAGSFLAAQEQPKAKAKPARVTVAAAKPTEPAKPKLTEEQRQALNLLEVSEAAARGAEPPMRSYSLLQIASSFPTPDEKRSRALLRDAFTASLEIHDDDETRAKLQEYIFVALLPFSLEDVQELLPQSEARVRMQTSESIISLYADKKQFDKAIELVHQVTGWDEFPYNGAGKLMDAMPADMIAEKQSLFLEAVNSYKNHKHPGIRIGGSLTGLITRHSAGMNPKVLMAAMEEVLSQSKSKDEKNQRAMTIGGDGGTVAFSSDYEYQLFALIPLIQQIDESRAKALLEENQSIQAMLQQFPLGMQSVDPPRKAAEKKDQPQQQERQVVGSGVSSASTDKANANMSAQQYQTMLARQRAQEIVAEAATDPVQALAHATTLPVTSGSAPISPRGNTLAAIARLSAKKDPAVAGQALSELRKIVPDMPLGMQSPALSTAASVYLEMGDSDSAAKIVSEGFKVAEKLLEKDLDPEDPNKALKAWWPSADAYRRFVEVQTKVSQRDTVNVLKEIKDPEIRAFESIMYARALLGLPMKRTMVAEKRKGMNRTSESTN
ncbi:MAG TPA: hypothetical protein VF532_23580 [Candidatus Angelobacter sp.]